MNKNIILSVLLLCVIAAGCETTRGLGQDVENSGRNVRETVDKND